MSYDFYIPLFIDIHMKSFLVYICIELPKEMGDLTRLKKLHLINNVNFTLPSDSGVWRLTGLEELILVKLPELKGNVLILFLFLYLY